MPKPTLNQADIELLKDIFATKDDLKQQRDEITDALIRYIDEVGVTKQEFQQVQKQVSLLPTKDEFVTRMDKLAGEYDKFSTDSPDIVAKQSELDDRLEVIETKLALTSN